MNVPEETISSSPITVAARPGYVAEVLAARYRQDNPGVRNIARWDPVAGVLVLGGDATATAMRISLRPVSPNATDIRLLITVPAVAGMKGSDLEAWRTEMRELLTEQVSDYAAEVRSAIAGGQLA
jgi:hypothetical protein